MSQIKEETEKADETLTPQKLNDMMELAPGFDSQKEENKQYRGEKFGGSCSTAVEVVAFVCFT